MSYQAPAIANEFIKLARSDGRLVTPMKVQKLVYFAHGWYLALTGTPLINEPVQAWRFGPVIPSLYHALKRHGDTVILNCITDQDLWGNGLNTIELHEFSVDDGPNANENERVRQFLKKIWEVYGGFTPIQLSNLTHAKDSPWAQTPDKEKKRGVVIEQDSISQYFSAQARQNQQHG